MKPENSEKLLIESLLNESITSNKISTIEILDIEKLTGDASTRKYFRVYAKDNTFVVCLDNPFDDTTGFAPTFLQVQSVFMENHVRVPLIYDCIPKKGYFLEEDLGNMTLLGQLATINTTDEELQIYKRSIDELIKIHSIEISKYPNSVPANLSFDIEKLMQEMNFTQKHFINGYLNIQLTEQEQKVYQQTLTLICNKIAFKKRVLTHRDFHSRNIMMKNDEQIIIDFQDARMGIPQYDLCSLLEDCYYQLDPNNRNTLINYYFTNRPKTVTDQDSFDEFLYYYDLVTVQRVFKAIGSFAYILKLRNDLRYIKYIGFAFEKMKSVLLKYPEFSEFRKVISRHYYAN